MLPDLSTLHSNVPLQRAAGEVAVLIVVSVTARSFRTEADALGLDCQAVHFKQFLGLSRALNLSHCEAKDVAQISS